MWALMYCFILLQWDLVCGRSFLPELSQIIREVGLGLAVLCGPLSDYFGRRPVHIAGNIMIAGLGIVVGLAPTFWIFALFRTLVAFADGVSMKNTKYEHFCNLLI